MTRLDSIAARNRRGLWTNLLASLALAGGLAALGAGLLDATRFHSETLAKLAPVAPTVEVSAPAYEAAPVALASR